MTKLENRSDLQKAKSSLATVDVIRVSPFELANMLRKQPNFELPHGKQIVIYDVDTNDLLAAISANDFPKRLQVLAKMMGKLGLSIGLEGSLAFGEFNIGDHSWTLSPGETGSLHIKTQPSTVVQSVTDMVNFLSKIEPGQGFPLKGGQSLVLTGLSAETMLNYHKLCQENEDLQIREEGQDKLFKDACPLLELKGLNLRVYGLHTSQIERHLDAPTGSILFKAIPENKATASHLILTLLESNKNNQR